MKEKRTNRTEVVEYDTEVVQEMLRYMYTNRVCDLKTHAGELLSIADMVSFCE